MIVHPIVSKLIAGAAFALAATTGTSPSVPAGHSTVPVEEIAHRHVQPCLAVVGFPTKEYSNNGQLARDVRMRNSCGSVKWYKACYIGADYKWKRDSGRIEPYEDYTTYLLMSGSSTPNSFVFREGNRSTDIDYPTSCRPSP